MIISRFTLTNKEECVCVCVLLFCEVFLFADPGLTLYTL